MKYRIEHDMLGEKNVPTDAYYGIHTLRAAENFPLSGRRVRPELIRALALVKKACCQANAELGFLDEDTASAVSTACDEIYEGNFSDQFITDALQGGAGTSTNMNINEVIANRALEFSGTTKGDYHKISPLNHINLHQSTNDVYPTALKVAAVFQLRELSKRLAALQESFQKKEKEFSNIVKIGRTETQDAVPMTLGAEFSAFAEAFARDRWRTFKAEERIRTVNLGGTAVGTGLTAPKRYIFLVIEKLRELSHLGLTRGENCVDQTANQDSLVEVSATLKACAVNFMKISRDLRQLHMIGEIRLQPVQAGSSIMPGKVNPVIPESVIQGAMSVFACDQLVGDCAASGTLQINEFMPLLADSLLTALELLSRLAVMLKQCVDNLTADPVRSRMLFDACPMIITAFIPSLGYERSLELMAEFRNSKNTDIRAFLKSRLAPELVERVLSPQNLVALGYR